MRLAHWVWRKRRWRTPAVGSSGHSSSRCVLFHVDPEVLAARRLPEIPASDMTEPYRRAVEGEVYGPSTGTPLPGWQRCSRSYPGAFLPPCFRLMGIRGLQAAEEK